MRLQEFVTRDLRNAVYRHLAHLPLGYFTQMKAGQILSRVINDTFEARLILTQIVTQGLQAASLVIVYIAILFSISWKLTLIALIILPLLGLSLQPMLRRLRKGNLRRGNTSRVLSELLTINAASPYLRLANDVGAVRHGGVAEVVGIRLA